MQFEELTISVVLNGSSQILRVTVTQLFPGITKQDISNQSSYSLYSVSGSAYSQFQEASVSSLSHHLSFCFHYLLTLIPYCPVQILEEEQVINQVITLVSIWVG